MSSQPHETTRASTIMVAYMAEVFPENPEPGARYYILGRDADDPNNIVVVDSSNHGGARNFCLTHRQVYPNKGRCEECAAKQLDAVLDTSG